MFCVVFSYLKPPFLLREKLTVEPWRFMLCINHDHVADDDDDDDVVLVVDDLSNTHRVYTANVR